MATRDKQHKEHLSPIDGHGQVIDFLYHYKARQIKSKQIEKSVTQNQPATAEGTSSACIPNGRLIVEHFDDGKQTLDITGIYCINPEIAMSASIELADFARQLWEAANSETQNK